MFSFIRPEITGIRVTKLYESGAWGDWDWLILQLAYHTLYMYAKGQQLLFGGYDNISIIRTVVSHCNSSIHTIQDPLSQLFGEK